MKEKSLNFQYLLSTRTMAIVPNIEGLKYILVIFMICKEQVDGCEPKENCDTTFVPDCLMNQTDFQADNIRMEADVPDVWKCQEHCQEEADCMGSVWIQPWFHFKPKGCFLKSSMLAAQRAQLNGVIAAPKYCLKQHGLPGDVFAFRNSSYRFMTQKTTLENAIETCESLHGALSSMETKEEYFFIRSGILQLTNYNFSLYSGNYHVGLRPNSLSFEWISGVKYDSNAYNVWCSEQPNTLSSVHGSLLSSEKSCINFLTDSQLEEKFICEFRGCLGHKPPSLTAMNAKEMKFDTTMVTYRVDQEQ
ncbi:uncharacterized protein LOC131878168 isoform X2 [Tigriopus californicus]|uniref:uncharacterized protein LOC131878168 isoform X2 n=1 Tax=Tigriopus californicus TaxID=6832 RepID=UPI0027DA75A6|nr:uncharacterized protein LOC131878168 isoform X2 [Tigriopus californicus]